MAAEQLPNDPRAILTATTAEEALRERAKYLHEMDFHKRAIGQHQQNIVQIERHIEWIDGSLKSFAEYIDLKTVKLTRGTIRLTTRDKYMYPEDVEAFLKTHPEFDRVKTIHELDKTAVKEHIKTTGNIPDGCDVKTETTVSVTMHTKVEEKF